MIRRLGTPPRQRTGTDRSMQSGNCPDLLLDGTRVIVIGRILAGLPASAPDDFGAGPGEMAVALPLSVFTDAARDLLDDQPKENPPCP